jgi:hypothetical protein
MPKKNIPKPQTQTNPKPSKSPIEKSLLYPKIELASKLNLWIVAVITIIYGVLMLYVALYHFEPWRDLAHIWVAVRDGSLYDIFFKLPIGAHPFLWMLLVKPLTLIGAPYISSIVLNVLFCIGSAYLLLRYAPIPLVIKILFIFSYPFIYEFAFPGRIYALGTFLLFLICHLDDQKTQKPVLYALTLALLMHTHAILMGVWAPLALVFVWSLYQSKKIRSKKSIAALGILIVSGLYFLWYIYQNNKFSHLLTVGIKKNFWSNTLSYSFLADTSNLLAIPIFAFIAYVLLLVRSSYILIGLFMLSISFYFLHSVVPEFLRFYLLFTVSIVSVLWLLCKELYQKKYFKDAFQKYCFWVFIFFFGFGEVISAKNGLQMLVREIEESHSDARGAGEFISKNYPDYTIIGHRSYTASSVVPYLPRGKQIWLADQKQNITYLTFDSLYYKTVFAYTYPEAIQNGLKKFPNEKKLLLLFSITIPESENANWNLVYATKKAQIQKDEAYFIYIKK